MLKDLDQVYICGRISGLSEAEFRNNFEEAAKFLRSWGFMPVNPLEIVPTCGETCESGLTFEDGSYQHHWRCYMKADIARLLQCKAIFAQANAVQSTGALLELQVARAVGMEVLNYDYDRTVRDGI